MVSAWEAAGVLGPVVLAFVAMVVSGVVSASPAASICFQRWTRRIVALALPNRGRCHRLLLKDFPPGPLHRCHSVCQHINPQAAQAHGPTNCLGNSIGKVLNQIWPLVQYETGMMLKPYQLPLLQDFIQTDAQTLIAFLLLTVKTCRTCDTADMESILDIKAYGDIVTVHLESHPMAPANTNLTKFEIERMIDGYPPFYRSTFSVHNFGVVTDFKSPISNTHHENISRGAWVLAVGLSVSDGPTPSLYNMKQLHQKNTDEYWKGTLVMSAFEMIGYTLNELKGYVARRIDVSGGSCEQALKCYNLMMRPDWSLKPWVLKVQEIESQALFGSLIGDCPCTRTCLGQDPHSE